MRRPLLAPERRTVTHFLPTSASTMCSPFRRPFGISTASMLEAFIQYLSMWVSGQGHASPERADCSASLQMAIRQKIASSCGGMSQPLALRYNSLICAAEPNSASRLNGERVMGLWGFYRSDCPDRPYETWCGMQELTALLQLSPETARPAVPHGRRSARRGPRQPAKT